MTERVVRKVGLPSGANYSQTEERFVHHRPYISLLATAALSSVLLVACGGGTGSNSTTTAPATTDAAVTTEVAQSTLASTTVASTSAPVEFDGPSFLDVIEPVVAPYTAALGLAPESADVRALLSALGEDVPVPAGLLINGIGHRWVKEFGATKDAQSASFDQFLDKAQLETFGAAVPSGWKQASSATSGSLTTLLLTHTDGRRVVLVSDSDASVSGTGRAPLELSLSTDNPSSEQPTWIASLPALSGGELVEYIEASGRIMDNLVGAGEYVLVRWRYPATQLDALKAYLTSGVVQSAGFTYDKDTFNGFEALVDIAIGNWTGTVLIGTASIDGVEYQDLVWALHR